VEETLANTKSALKRIRSSERKRRANRMVRSAARTAARNARQLIAAGDRENAATATRQAIRALDKAAQKGVIHPNSAARRKSRLMRYFNQMFQATSG